MFSACPNPTRRRRNVLLYTFGRTNFHIESSRCQRFQDTGAYYLLFTIKDLRFPRPSRLDSFVLTNLNASSGSTYEN